MVTDMEKGVPAYLGDPVSPPLEIDQDALQKVGGPAAALFGGADLFQVDWPLPEELDAFPLALLQDRSPRSNLDVLAKLHREGESLPAGLVCLARTGEGFLGRHGRSWRCLPGNLHAVIHLKPEIPLAEAGPAFSMLSALACAEALDIMAPSGAAPRIRWVNDVYLDGRKVAGALTRQTYQAPMITDVFLGIGVNVLADPRLPANPFVPATGSLKDLRPRIAWSPGGFLRGLLSRLRSGYDLLRREGPGPLLDRYRKASGFVGRAVRVYEDGPGFDEYGLDGRRLLARGVVDAILDDLSLEIRGAPDPLPSGRLAFEEDCP